MHGACNGLLLFFLLCVERCLEKREPPREYNLEPSSVKARRMMGHFGRRRRRSRSSRDGNKRRTSRLVEILAAFGTRRQSFSTNLERFDIHSVEKFDIETESLRNFFFQR